MNMDSDQGEFAKEPFWQRHSARNFMLFSLSWILLLHITMPMLIIHCLPLLLTPSRLASGSISGIVFLIIVRYLPVIAGLVVLILAQFEITRRHFSSEWPLLAVGVTFFYCFFASAMVVTPVLIKQKRYWYAAVGTTSFCGFLSLWLLDLTSSYSIQWTLFWISFVALIVAVGGCRARHPLNLRCLWPLALTAIYVVGLYAYRVKLAHDLQQERRELSELVGQSVELRDFIARESQGLPMDEEPLKTLIASKPGDNAAVMATSGLDEHLAYVNKMKEDAPDFVAAAEALVKMPVTGIRRDFEGCCWEDNRFPELSALRQVAKYFRSDLVAHCKDRDLVLSRCADLERLRDWVLSEPFLTARLVAIAIEQMYLQALACPLAAGTLTDGDWDRLLTRKPDWGKHLANSFGNEATFFQRTVEYVLKEKDLPAPWFDTENALLTVSRFQELLFPPSAYEIILLCDYRFALRWFRNQHTFLYPGKLTAKQRADLALIEDTSLIYAPYVLSTMLLPALSRIHTKYGEMENQYHLVSIGRAAVAYRRQHGHWPESLDALPETPLDEINRLPFLSEQGEITDVDRNGNTRIINGFRVYARNSKGEDPGGARAVNAFTIFDQLP